MLSEDVLECYLKAGKIAAETRNKVRSIVKEGVPLIKICEEVENAIRERDGEPAFPCNICINEVAAHYSSPPGDRKTVPKGAMVKVDLGVHVDGYIADTATTISLNPELDGMVYAVNEALIQAVNTTRPGVRTDQIGEIVKGVIERHGYKPIWNLTGHQMSKFVLHTGKSIPNVPKFGSSKINIGEVFAIEPFLTLSSGIGEVQSSTDSYIFRLQRDREVKSASTKKLLKTIRESFRSLPFSKRWVPVISGEEIDKSFDELLATKALTAYPVLIEKGGKAVAQAEHTVIVTEKGCIVTTL